MPGARIYMLETKAELFKNINLTKKPLIYLLVIKLIAFPLLLLRILSWNRWKRFNLYKPEYFPTNANHIWKNNSYTCSVNDSPWIKITIIIASFCINQFTRVCSVSLRKRKNNQYCVQEFSADREFHELTRQGGKLGVLQIVIYDANFLNKL